MNATEANLLLFLKKSPQFVIPIYQRNYSWTEEQCLQLWNDMLRAGTDDKVKAHFIGSIVYIERGLSTVTSQEPLLVIDGQQRLTTSSLLIAALAEHLEKNKLDELLDAFSARKLRNYYLLNSEEEGERRHKLLLSETDKDTLLSILDNAPQPKEHSTRIAENYARFQSLIADQANKIETICKGLSKLTIVDVSLDRTQDNPQLIFESMNSTGLKLSQADLIRNYILMGLEPKLQAELYKNYWRPMEKDFGQAAYVTYFDAFMRHYLTAKTGEIPKQSEVYVAFKKYAQIDSDGDTRKLVTDIATYAKYYCAMALDQEQEPPLRMAFKDLRDLGVDVAYPFLLDVYNDYSNQIISGDDLAQAVRLAEGFVFRRAICNLPSNSLGRTFAVLSRSLKKDRYLESLQAALLLLPSYRRFPNDEEFEREIKVRNLYKFSKGTYWIRRLENAGRKERIAVEEYTIEHVLPQNENLSPAWQKALGLDWQRIQQTWLHTLGNLTLTAYNSEYSDEPYSFKRDKVEDKEGRPIGLAHSPLRLNQGFGEVEIWTEDAIKARADRLAKEAIKIWAPPILAADIVDAYRPSTAVGSAYSIDDHSDLAAGITRELFEALRQAVKAMDPCVSEQFLKLCVAYKAETNFVDVVPQSKRLRLSLNIPFHEIDDPKRKCRDVTAVGRWGNGDTEVIFASMDELPYVLGLVRQAFARQMEDAVAT